MIINNGFLFLTESDESNEGLRFFFFFFFFFVYFVIGVQISHYLLKN